MRGRCSVHRSGRGATLQFEEIVELRQHQQEAQLFIGPAQTHRLSPFRGAALDQHQRAEVDFKVDRRGSAAEVELSVVDENGRYPRGLEPALRVVGPAADVRTVPLRQTAPGRYRASVPVSISASSPWRFELDAEGIPKEVLDRAGRTRTVFYPYPDEYRFYPPDVEKLEAISRETGGKVGPTVDEIFEVGDDRASVPTALAPFLMALALVLYLLDIAVRRAPWLWQRLGPASAGGATARPRRSASREGGPRAWLAHSVRSLALTRRRD